jgi:hypothetical protein
MIGVAQVVMRFKSRVDRISYALGFRRMLPSSTIKRRKVAATMSTPTRRSRIDLTEKPISRGQTFAEPHSSRFIEHIRKARHLLQIGTEFDPIQRS